MPKKYSFPDYDKNLALKPSFEMWLVILYFLRPLILQISSIQMGGGNQATGASGLRDTIYPDDFSFFIAILATLPTIPVLIAYIKRAPGASNLIKTLWRNGRIFLISAAILNIIIVIAPLAMESLYHINKAGWVQLAITIGILIFLSTSQRVKDTFSDFPEKSDD